MAPNRTALVIVESPKKANQIRGFLGAGYDIEASRGHVCDLPTNASEIPAKFKGEKWARLGVNVDDHFDPLYVVLPRAKSVIKDLKDRLNAADELYLATDDDREGEAIAWHLMRQLKPKVPVHRMVFHEITQKAIQEAIANPRAIDTDLVDAQETRRILDRLYGYEVSPVLWKKVMPRLSAGRVQSVATRLIVERERERIAFRSADYWDLDATLDAGENADPRLFPARLMTLDGQRVAQGRDFNSHGKHTGNSIVLDQPGASAVAAAFREVPFEVVSVESKAYTRRPYPPFRTTTMTQEAARKLGFTTDRTMRVAQELYEGGFITYMRTDSVTLSETAIQAARDQATHLFGADYVPAKPRIYANTVKNAQEAHEAIRPAGEVFRTPAQTGLRGDEFRLYELIWMRTIASQMKDAEGQTLTVKMTAQAASPVQLQHQVSTAGFQASGRTITFYGFLKAYVESLDDDDAAAADDQQTRLPALVQGQRVRAESLEPAGHSTKPPARYTEPTLIAKLEELKIGRPSTYSAIIGTITARDYVFKKGTALVPTWLAFAVTRLLEEHFPKLVDYQFTADMEETLDEIADGDARRVEVLNDFYFGGKEASEGLHTLVTQLGDIDARALSTFPIGDLDSGIVLRVGRYGSYVEDSEGNRANVDAGMAPDELTTEAARQLLANPTGAEREVGTDPENGRPIVARTGRFGPYVTEVLDDDAPKSAKPRTASLFASMDIESVTLEQALQLLSLPRVVGDDDGVQITAQNGRYGPYLKKGTDSRSLAGEDQIFTITLEQAKEIYAQPKQRGRAAAAAPLKELGTDPESNAPIVVKDGRFGPYVTDGTTNATLRRTDSIEAITHERAVELLAEKRAKGPAPARAKRTTTRTAKAPAKAGTAKTTATKTAAKTTRTSRAKTQS